MQSNRKNLILGSVVGVCSTILIGLLMGQGASQPVKSETSYFVTGEGDNVHLWVRDGVNLRCVGHGECKTHGHDHKEGDGHNHPK